MTTAISKARCFLCGLRQAASIHGPLTEHGLRWWQHDYEPGLLTRG